MKEILKWVFKEFWYPMVLTAGVVVCGILINSILIQVPKPTTCQTCTTLTAQINEIERNQGDLYRKVQSNKDVLVSHDTHFVDMGYPACYERVVLDDAEYYDSYGETITRQYR
jgi:hypothetical protein